MKRFLLPTLLVSAAFCLASCGAASSPRATAKRFYKAIAEGDSSRALECTDIDEEDAELYCVIMEKAHSSVEEKGGISKIEVSELPSAQESAEEDPQRTVVFVRIDYSDVSWQEEYCDMVSVDGKWKVNADFDSK